MATIGLEGARFTAPHGFYPEEQLTENEFIIDLYVDTNVQAAAMQDDLGLTVNYSTLYLLIQMEMRKPTQLIEALAQRIVDRVQDQFSRISGVKIRLRKLNPPLSGPVAASVVEIATGSFGRDGVNPRRMDQPRVFDDPLDDEGFDDEDFDEDDFDPAAFFQ
jgi:dihydroneopterin aldolase